jgi:hypothetical protein
MDDPSSLDRLRAHIECQQPTVNLYQFIGKLTVYSSTSQSTSFSASVKSEALGVDNLLLRGARLKDTDFIYGIFTFTKTNLWHLTVHCPLFFRMRCLHRQ